MSTNKMTDSYDDAKRMLKIIRQIQSTSKPKYGMIKEQVNASDDQSTQGTDPEVDTRPASGEPNDLNVINNVEVQIHSEDPESLQLSDEEKGKISQMIDDFRKEVSGTAQFDKLQIYETSAKLDGQMTDIGLTFTLSTGDDTGLYINAQMLKIEQKSFDALTKLTAFQIKFSTAINDILVTRRNV